MKKPALKKKNAISLREKKLWIIIALLVIAQVMAFMYIVRMNKTLHEQSNVLFGRLLKSVEEERYRYPVIDIAENRVYIPELHVYLPLNDTTRDVRYDFRSGDNAALYFSLPVAIGHQIDVDDPACDKMVAITKEKLSGASYEFVGEVAATHDGLKYVSRHTACQIYPDSSSKELADIVKQIQSYE